MKHYILLDRSGSMALNWEEMSAALEAYILGLKTGKVQTKIHLAAFDSAPGLEYSVVLDKVSPSDLGFTLKFPSPRGMTPLYDAIGELDQRISSKSPKKASIVIVTDGNENSSWKFKRDEIRKIIDAWNEKGYEITFFGASFDNFSQSASIGGSRGQTISVNTGAYVGTMAAMSQKSAEYSDSGVSRGFTEEERNLGKRGGKNEDQ